MEDTPDPEKSVKMDPAPRNAFAQLATAPVDRGSLEGLVLDFFFAPEQVLHDGERKRVCSCGDSTRCCKKKGGKWVNSKHPLWSHLGSQKHHIFKNTVGQHVKDIEASRKLGQAGFRASSADCGLCRRF